jgi:hypothetical protein
MSVALEYETVGPVTSEVRARIEASARRASPRGGWWAEGIAFAPGTGEPGPLSGSTKLMLPGVAPELDAAMALRDAAFIVRRLAWWSLRHGVAWRLSVEGEDLGVVRRGVPSSRTVLRLVQAAGLARAVARTPFLRPLRRRALREHADRWDAGRAPLEIRAEPVPDPRARQDAARARREREAQSAFREGRFSDVLTAVAAAEEYGPLSELAKRYRTLARKRLGDGPAGD